MILGAGKNAPRWAKKGKGRKMNGGVGLKKKRKKDEGYLGGEVQFDTGEQTCLHFLPSNIPGKVMIKRIVTDFDSSKKPLVVRKRTAN